MKTQEQATRQARETALRLQSETEELRQFLSEDLGRTLSRSADFEAAELAYEKLQEATRAFEAAREELGWIGEQD